MTVQVSQVAGLFPALAAALLLLGLPLALAFALAPYRARSAAALLGEMALCAAFGAAAYFTVGSWLLFGADKGGLIGLPPGSSRALAGDVPDAAAMFLYHLGLALTSFWMLYAACGERLTRSGNALVCAAVCALAFPVAGHWTLAGSLSNALGSGWLFARGFADAAGAATALACGAGAALAGLCGGEVRPVHGRPLGFHANAPATGAALGIFALAAAFGGAAKANPAASLAAIAVGAGSSALAAKATGLAALAGGRAAAQWLAGLADPKRLKYLKFGQGLDGEAALGCAAGVAAMASCLSLAPWWAIVPIGFAAGAAAWLGDAVFAAAAPPVPARLAAALGIGAFVGAGLGGLLAAAHPSPVSAELLAVGGAALCGIELSGLAAVSAWAMAVVHAVNFGLGRAQRAIAGLPEA